MPNAIFIELPYDKLREVIINYGFEILNDSMKKATFGTLQDFMRLNEFYHIFLLVEKGNLFKLKKYV